MEFYFDQETSHFISNKISNLMTLIIYKYTDPILEDEISNIPKIHPFSIMLSYPQYSSLSSPLFSESTPNNNESNSFNNELETPTKLYQSDDFSIEEEKVPYLIKNGPDKFKSYFSENDTSRVYLEDSFTIENKNNRKPRNLLQIDWDKRILKPEKLREGWMQKKCNTILSEWENVWVVVSDHKLQYYKDRKTMKIKGGINFRLTNCNLSVNDNLLTLSIPLYKKELKLKALNKSLAQSWYSLINRQISKFSSEKKLKLKSECVNKYLEGDFLNEDEFVEICETGDLLLFETDNFPAKFQRSLTGSKYDHVALIIRMNEEAWILDSQSDKGVNLMKWQDFIDWNDLFVRVYYRKLQWDDKYNIEDAFLQFVGDNVGKKYKISISKLLRKKSFLEQGNSQLKYEGFFCSELIAAAYKSVNLIDSSIACSQYWPSNFSTEKNLKLLKGAFLSREIPIIIQRDLKCENNDK